MTLPLPGILGAHFVLPHALSLEHLAHRPTSKGIALSRKGAPWSDDEHKAFLAGLKVYGRGQWKQISRFYVPSRTPTQVASHAQKHFLRQSGAQKRRSRFSAVEEAAAAAVAAGPLAHALAVPAPVHVAPLPLPPAPGAQQSLVVSSSSVPPATGVPGLVGHPAASPFLPPPRPPLARQGAAVGGIAMGVPIGVLPPLPSITTASGTELPILPVMPGRINALAPSPTVLPPPPAAAASSYSGDSSGSGSRGASPALQPTSALPPLPEVPLHSRASSAGLPQPSTRTAAAAAAYTPSGRAQQLFRLLDQCGAPPADGASSGSAPTYHQPHLPPSQQQSSGCVPSATAALDTLALLAEAEAEAQSCESHGAGAAAAAAAAQQRGAPLVSAF